MAAIVTGIYTLTPTHPGTGQATSTVDLPVARDAATGFPILPATSLKGVARSTLGSEDPRTADLVKVAFGPTLQDAQGGSLSAGNVVFGEGQLLLYPLRALHRPVVHATCPLLLRRWDRLLRAHGLAGFSGLDDVLGRVETPQRGSNSPLPVALAAERPPGALVLEDYALPAGSVESLSKDKLVSALAPLLPDGEFTRQEIGSGLLVLPDALLASLLRRVLPVQARIKLGANKTTSEDGNLWSEEVLPSDALFGVILSDREIGARQLDELAKAWGATRNVQIGGNETVGMGRCWWTWSTQTRNGANGGRR